MKPRYIFYLQAAYMLLMVLCQLSCRKFVEIEPAPHLVETKAVFQSDKTALSAISGVYTQLRSNTTLFTNGGLSINGGLAADEIFATSPNTTTDPFYQNNLLAVNITIANSFYNTAYRIIYQTNSILEGLSTSANITDTLKNQLMGEMKTIRSFLYFYLINLFGDVPLVITSDYTANETKPRTATGEIYNQIIADLTDAENLLQPAYASAGKVRINRWSATALLARIYLYQQQWDKAASKSSAVIESGNYSLATAQNLGNVFLKNSSETIWEIASSNDRTPPGEALAFIPTSASIKPTYALTGYLLGAFETGDQRKTKWMAKNTVSGIDYWYPFKYKQRTVATGSAANENEIALRLPEQYLIRAEARAQMDNMGGAKDDLNLVRYRAGLAATTASTKEEVLNAIMNEKRVEYFTEWGHRWLDLKRTHQSSTILSPIKGSDWQDTDILWPIPQNELLYNPNLVQNPGY